MKKTIYILAAALALASCGKEAEPGRNYVVGDDEIRFYAAGYVPSTKGDLDTNVEFGASATLTTGGQTYEYFNNQEIYYDTDASAWKGYNRLAWPKGLEDNEGNPAYTLDFQCYAPWNNSPWCKVSDDGKLGTDGPVTVATINPADSNYDLMYSDKITGKTADNSTTGVPVTMHHALASVGVGVNIVRSNDAVILDANHRYTYEEWEKSDDPESDWMKTRPSYIVPIGSHPNDTLGIVLKEGTVLSGPVVVFDPDDDTYKTTKILDEDFVLDRDYIQYQKFGYRLKNSIQNVWIASLIECRFENLANTGEMSMALNEDGKTWKLPENEVWTMDSEGEAGVAAHSTSVVIFNDKDIEIPPSMRSTTHVFPFELRIVPQDLNWSPLTPTNNQKMHIKMKVRQYNYKDHAVNDKNDQMSDGTPTGDEEYFDYRDIYQYDVWDGTDGVHPKGSFKAWLTQTSELAPGVTYENMIWREKVWRKKSADPEEWEEVNFKPTYEYIVEKDIYLYDVNQFVATSTVPEYWKMNTKTVYVTRINFAGHLMEFSPEVLQYSQTEVEGGGI